MFFKKLADDKTSRARLGQVTTPHGAFPTPVFMPPGTKATVKTLNPSQLKEAKVEILLCNAYYLTLRPGIEIIKKIGGLHKFMGWDGPILTDSGGYQVFSLAAPRSKNPRLIRINDEGVEFRSYIDGSSVFFTPERVIEIEEALGADIIMPFDQPVAYPCEYEMAKKAMERTLDWAQRSKNVKKRDDQVLFGIVQGGIFPDLRQECIARLEEMDFPGYAMGGLSVGEGNQKMIETLAFTVKNLPVDKPRYLMGVGLPRDILTAVREGVDMFDCVLPTRNGRNSWGFIDPTPDVPEGILRIKNSGYKDDELPIDRNCGCYTCRNFSRAYLRHLFNSEEILGLSLMSLHNLYYFETLMERIRAVIKTGQFESFYQKFIMGFGV